VNALLTLTVVGCLGWMRHYRSIDKRAVLAWVELSFFGAAVVLLLNTKIGEWSVLDWIMGLGAVMVLYGAGVTASMFVEKLLRRQMRTRRTILTNGAER
jgi:hypothetical protein